MRARIDDVTATRGSANGVWERRWGGIGPFDAAANMAGSERVGVGYCLQIPWLVMWLIRVVHPTLGQNPASCVTFTPAAAELPTLGSLHHYQKLQENSVFFAEWSCYRGS